MTSATGHANMPGVNKNPQSHSQCLRNCGRVMALMAWLGTATNALAATNPTPPASNRCSLQIIVVMNPPAPQPPVPTVVASLARAARVQLTFVREAGSTSFVFLLSASGSAQQCQRGLTRLRTDARIQSVDIDARRKPATDSELQQRHAE
jgi:hypothetical protein